MSETLTVVPSPDDMNDLTFVRHVHKRHRVDFKHWPDMTEEVDEEHVNLNAEWVAAWRVYHDRCHALRLNDYDHEHKIPEQRSA